MRTTTFPIAVLLAISAIVLAGPARAVTGVYMVADGEFQGLIQGSVQIPGHEGEMQVTRIDHLIDTEFDPLTGLPTGRRLHHPFVIRKPVDRATPRLLLAYASTERLVDVWIKFFRLDYVGMEEQYFTVHLINALVVSHEQAVPEEVDPQTGAQSHWEEIACTYQRIGWMWEPEGIYMEDGWQGETGGLVIRPDMDGSSLRMWPNPSRGEATIAFGAPVNLPAELRILDVGGRMLRQLSAGPGGEQQVAWDGRDSDGRQLPDGTYFIRLEWSGGTASKAVTLIR